MLVGCLESAGSLLQHIVPLEGPGCCLWGGGLIAGGRLSPSIGGGAFLTIAAPPCFAVAGIVPAPVESFAAGGDLYAGPFGFPVFSGRKLPSIALYFSPSELGSPAPVFHTVQLSLHDCHWIVLIQCNI